MGKPCPRLAVFSSRNPDSQTPNPCPVQCPVRQIMGPPHHPWHSPFQGFPAPLKWKGSEAWKLKFSFLSFETLIEIRHLEQLLVGEMWDWWRGSQGKCRHALASEHLSRNCVRTPTCQSEHLSRNCGSDTYLPMAPLFFSLNTKRTAEWHRVIDADGSHIVFQAFGVELLTLAIFTASLGFCFSESLANARQVHGLSRMSIGGACSW